MKTTSLKEIADNSILFSFGSISRLENICLIIQQIDEGGASYTLIEFILEKIAEIETH